MGRGRNRFEYGYFMEESMFKQISEKMYILFLCINRWSGECLYYVLRNGEQVSNCYFAKKNDEKFLHSIQHLVDEIENGDFDHKKTESEKIAEIIRTRNLTACMNNTKWKEFIKAIS